MSVIVKYIFTQTKDRAVSEVDVRARVPEIHIIAD